jgi:DNA-binding MarR family transcriptional regulator
MSRYYRSICGIRLTQPQFAILYATTQSENAQTLEDLAKKSRYQIGEASRAMDGLVHMGILYPIESYDNRTLFGYQENDTAQSIYCSLHRVSPIN